VQNLTISSAESHYYRYNYFIRVFSEPAIYDEIKVYSPPIKVWNLKNNTNSSDELVSNLYRLIFIGPSLDKLAFDSARKKRSIKATETVLMESGQYLFSSAFANFIVDINQKSIVDNIEVVQKGTDKVECSFTIQSKGLQAANESLDLMKSLLTSTTAQFEIRGSVYSVYANGDCMLQVDGQCSKPSSLGKVRSDVQDKRAVDSFDTWKIALIGVLVGFVAIGSAGFGVKKIKSSNKKPGKVNDEQLDLNANSENNLNNDDDLNSLKNIVEEMTEVENKEEKSKKSFKNIARKVMIVNRIKIKPESTQTDLEESTSLKDHKNSYRVSESLIGCESFGNDKKTYVKFRKKT